MATQITSDVIADAEWYLSAFERELDEAIEVLSQWHALVEIERMDFWAEWPLVLDHLLRVETYRSQTVLTADHKRRLAAARHGLSLLEPRIRRAFEYSPAPAESNQLTS